MIFTVRTTVGREKTAIDSINVKVGGTSGPIKAVMSPAELKGYIFVEGDDEELLVEELRSVPHVKGLIRKPVDIEQLESFFTQKIEVVTFKEGDLVEVIGGPFKKEKAKVTRINDQKGEAKVELVDATVPIPITIKLDLLKKINN
ncbi:MAG: transcription elongation factor Spt5 [Candidatus Aenigmarchaeota archaeon]|nr:transcription elongation factor Spt5 [Candidatus Aenigmarchaeota archaeon]MCK5042898.1 transcription elongation factor Spt5 [Candidatus Aenigmarchaeota archaeon]MCK5062622.1 transcription elongation factor Spt5 [Candidatus Aenigmarchaeota archaeon]MCK5289453.1 transcription elongation factor Spt5 [Candidatus Aenigmarchaeota archaeon]MCK5372988.1 transcription elongation factor Spt5 [Candidatus Aenigmarchaeota archaeon]